MPINPAGVRVKQVGTGSSATVVKPTNTIQGDLMVVLAAGTTAPTAPGGWTQLTSNALGSATIRVFYKIALSSDAATVNYTFTNALFYEILCLAGHDVNSPIGAFLTDTDAATTAPSNPGVTTTRARSGILAFVSSSLGTSTYTPPGGYSELSDTSGSEVAAVTTVIANEGTATGALTWTASVNDTHLSVVIEIKSSPVCRRFYLPISGAPPISPAFDAAWERNTEADRVLAVDVKGSSAITSHTFRGSGVSPNDAINRQYLIGPLAAQKVQGAIQCVVRASENATTANCMPQLGVRVVAPDGTTFRGTCLALDTGGLQNEFGTALTNRFFPSNIRSRDLSPVDAQEGDYLVVEIGANYTSTSVATTDALSFGENAADLVDDIVSTTAGAPWLEFSSGLWLRGELVSPQTLVQYMRRR